MYTVGAGDSLQSIARGAYGDAGLWYRIADANGLSGNSDLRVGQALTIPNRVGTGSNNASSFKPYDPSKVQGDTTPNLPTPQNDDGCGGLGAILMVIVAVAVTVITYGALGAYSPIIAGAISGAAGAVASQVVGNAVGVLDGFDWKAVALGAIGGAVSGGLSGLNLAGGALNSTANVIVRAAIGNALTQGIAVATGLQDQFNWKGVAAAAVGAGVGSALSEGLGDTIQRDDGGEAILDAKGNYARWKDTGPLAHLGQAGAIARASLSGFAAGLSTAAARGGRVSVTQVATDAFGNALGSSLADNLSAPSQTQVEPPDASAGDVSPGNASYSLAGTSGYGLGLRPGGGSGLSYGGLRANNLPEPDTALVDDALVDLPGFDRFEPGPVVAGPCGAPSQLTKVGASTAWRAHQKVVYEALDDLNAASSMGGQDPARLAELRSSVNRLNSSRIAMQTDPVVMQEVLNRGLTSRNDLDKLGMLGAFGDPNTVQRIAVAVTQAGGVGRASAQNIAFELNALDGLDASAVNLMPGDMSIKAAAPGLYLNTLLGMRSHVDTTMLYVASMSGEQMAQLGRYTDTVIAQGGMTRYQDNERLAGLFSGMQATNQGIQRVGDGFSVVGLGLRNFANSLGASLGAKAMNSPGAATLRSQLGGINFGADNVALYPKLLNSLRDVGKPSYKLTTAADGTLNYTYGSLNKGHGVMANLKPDGTLSMEIQASNPMLRARLGSGTDMYNEMMGVIGPQNVRQINGIWSRGSGLTSNLQQYEANFAVTGNKESAAALTWSGKRAASYGFVTNRVDMTNDGPRVVFRRP